MHILYFLIAFSSSVLARSRFDPATVPPLSGPPPTVMNASELMDYYGYKWEEYSVTTEDGYILPLLRMGTNSGPPVLMVNGIGIAPNLWLAYGPYHSLPYVLHDLGYDIWFPGKRGVSLKHKTLKWTDPQFWDFSHDEHGMYDMPPQIDLVVKITGHSKLLYVGASLGGSVFMSLCSLRPEYCGMFAGNAQVVPAMYMPKLSEMSLPAQFSWTLNKLLTTASRRLKLPYVMVDPSIFTTYNICNKLERVCYQFLFVLTGYLPEQMDKAWLNFIIPLSAGGISIKQVEHYIQMVTTGGTPMYDYGREMNMKKYGQVTPPQHNLSTITQPTLMICSSKDYYVPLPTMKKAAKLIGKNAVIHLAPDRSYGHAALVLGSFVYKQYFTEIVDFFDSITGLK